MLSLHGVVLLFQAYLRATILWKQLCSRDWTRRRPATPTMTTLFTAHRGIVSHNFGSVVLLPRSSYYRLPSRRSWTAQKSYKKKTHKLMTSMKSTRQQNDHIPSHTETRSRRTRTILLFSAAVTKTCCEVRISSPNLSWCCNSTVKVLSFTQFVAMRNLATDDGANDVIEFWKCCGSTWLAQIWYFSLLMT